jgi:hypothetical protein
MSNESMRSTIRAANAADSQADGDPLSRYIDTFIAMRGVKPTVYSEAG